MCHTQRVFFTFSHIYIYFLKKVHAFFRNSFKVVF